LNDPLGGVAQSLDEIGTVDIGIVGNGEPRTMADWTVRKQPSRDFAR
jgi:hypothetical protein